MNVASAVQKNGGASRFNLSRYHLTTAKIGQILPIFHQECVPGDSFDVNCRMFARFAPLSVPAFCKLDYRTLSVFVPYHQVADGCESYFANQKKFKGVSNMIPYTTFAEIKEFYLHQGITTATPSGEQYDISIDGSFRNLTALGQYCHKLLQCLGYRIPKEFRTSVTRKINMLPLLAFAHAYNSFMSYSVTMNDSALSNTLESIKRRSTDANLVAGGSIWRILTSILLTYESSFITSAWCQPYVSGTADTSTTFNTLYKDALGSGEPYVGFDEGNGGFTELDRDSHLTASQMRMLMKFDDFFRRSAYAGSKDIEQIYARFGKRIDDYKTRYPYFLGETSQQVQIGDVTSTADTDGAVVGDYAGKAISNGDARFKFSSSDYGMLFVFGWFAPTPMYYAGMDKECLRIDPFDFYTPELDNGFASPIEDGQIHDNGVTPQRTVGYCPLYSEYMYGRDQITGNFDRFEDFKAWHFGRTDYTDAQTDTTIYLANTGTIYERIFNIDNPETLDQDTIYMTCHNECHAVRPMKDFAGKAELGENGIEVDVNGSQIN